MPSARPFLKWAGSKKQLLSQLEPLFPSEFGRYSEPFVGSGAVFFHLWNHGRLGDEVFLLDGNDELINVYQVVRDQVEALIARLAVHQTRHNQEYFYHIRGLDREEGVALAPVERAARTIYLNKTCYNGLFRVNSRGQFNAPMGRYRNPAILQEDVLRGASVALHGAHLRAQDFRAVTELARPGDFFYFDPPYVPLSETAHFTSYTAASFGPKEQQALAGVFAALAEKGCYCMLSNSYTPIILDLYQDFRIEVVTASRAINSDAGGRGRVREVVVLSY
ncbi:MAG: DNA adenine methylase [Caldilineales bacterium]|nr:DNA adenine methylase [Caldilineales bacterium]